MAKIDRYWLARSYWCLLRTWSRTSRKLRQLLKNFSPFHFLSCKDPQTRTSSRPILILSLILQIASGVQRLWLRWNLIQELHNFFELPQIPASVRMIFTSTFFPFQLLLFFFFFRYFFYFFFFFLIFFFLALKVFRGKENWTVLKSCDVTLYASNSSSDFRISR